MVDNVSSRQDYDEEADDRAVRLLEDEIADRAAGRQSPEAAAAADWEAQN
jgi:hypothetical protein